MKAIRNYEWNLEDGQTLRAEITVNTDSRDEPRIVDGLEINAYREYTETTEIALYRDGVYLKSAKEIKYGVDVNDKSIITMKIMLGLGNSRCAGLDKAVIEAKEEARRLKEKEL